ncbi:MAG: metallophosphoesterase [Polyangiales bacterium]
MRVLHLSDVHVTIPLSHFPWRQMLNKRFIGAVNLTLRRGRHYAHAREKLQALAEFSAEHDIDLVIATGDYTALGTDPELAAARQAIQALTTRPNGYVTVPGNHDIYLADVVREQRFERHFGEFLQSDLPERCVDGPWPLVRLYGDRVAVIAVNSARPNPEPWRSNGAIPGAQLDALAALCRESRFQDRFVFVATHYAPRRADATPDHHAHGLENADAFLDACRGLKRGAIVHGHIHKRFQLTLPNLRARIFGAGSTTCEGREGLWLFDIDIDSAQATAVPGSYRAGRYVLEPDASVSF